MEHLILVQYEDGHIDACGPYPSHEVAVEACIDVVQALTEDPDEGPLEIGYARRIAESGDGSDFGWTLQVGVLVAAPPRRTPGGTSLRGSAECGTREPYHGVKVPLHRSPRRTLSPIWWASWSSRSGSPKANRHLYRGVRR